MSIQDTVRLHRERWIMARKFKMPTLADALDFMVTEAGEAKAARLRLGGGYTRNNDKPIHAMDLADEVADTVIMACFVMDLLNLDLEKVVTGKLEKMSLKRDVEI